MESKLLANLRGWGCDVDGAMERMLNDEDFYLTMLRETLALGEIEALGECLESGDEKKAFMLAHDLKGVLGNVGLTPMYKLDCEIVEALRGKTGEDVTPVQRRLLALAQELGELVEKSTR